MCHSFLVRAQLVVSGFLARSASQAHGVTGEGHDQPDDRAEDGAGGPLGAPTFGAASARIAPRRLGPGPCLGESQPGLHRVGAYRSGPSRPRRRDHASTAEPSGGIERDRAANESAGRTRGSGGRRAIRPVNQRRRSGGEVRKANERVRNSATRAVGWDEAADPMCVHWGWRGDAVVSFEPVAAVRGRPGPLVLVRLVLAGSGRHRAQRRRGRGPWSSRSLGDRVDGAGARRAGTAGGAGRVRRWAS